MVRFNKLIQQSDNENRKKRQKVFKEFLVKFIQSVRRRKINNFGGKYFGGKYLGGKYLGGKYLGGKYFGGKYFGGK